MTSFEYEILQELANRTPFPFDEVKRIFEATLSIDKTIFVLQWALENAKDPAEIVIADIKNDGAIRLDICLN